MGAAAAVVVVVEAGIFWEVLVPMLVATGAFGDIDILVIDVDARRNTATNPVRTCLSFGCGYFTNS